LPSDMHPLTGNPCLTTVVSRPQGIRSIMSPNYPICLSTCLSVCLSICPVHPAASRTPLSQQEFETSTMSAKPLQTPHASRMPLSQHSPPWSSTAFCQECVMRDALCQEHALAPRKCKTRAPVCQEYVMCSAQNKACLVCQECVMGVSVFISVSLPFRPPVLLSPHGGG
jgi:hypothetical protein